MKKKSILYIMFIGLFVYPSFATYYEISTDILLLNGIVHIGFIKNGPDVR